MAKKKYGAGAQIGTGTASAVAVGGAGYAIGEVLKWEPGKKRAGIGALLALLIGGGMYAFEETRELAIASGVGGLVGAAGLLLEPKVREMIADRRAAREIAADEERAELDREYEEAFSYPQPQVPQAPAQPIVVYEAPKARAPSEREQWMGLLGTVVEEGFGVLGSYVGKGAKGMTFGRGAGMTFGRGAMGMFNDTYALADAAA